MLPPAACAENPARRKSSQRLSTRVGSDNRINMAADANYIFDNSSWLRHLERVTFKLEGLSASLARSTPRRSLRRASSPALPYVAPSCQPSAALKADRSAPAPRRNRYERKALGSQGWEVRTSAIGRGLLAG